MMLPGHNSINPLFNFFPDIRNSGETGKFQKTQSGNNQTRVIAIPQANGDNIPPSKGKTRKNAG